MIALLLRLYPARWRARYGDEFAAVLEQASLGPFDVADVVLSALDAHRHLHGLGAASEHRKGFAMTLRIGGYAAIAGGLLWFASIFLASLADDGYDTVWQVILAVAMVMLIVGLTGLSALQARRNPRLVWAAFALPAIGAIVSIVGALGMALVGDHRFLGDLSPWSVWVIGTLALLVGSALFGIATMRAATLSRAGAALLVAGGVILVPVLAGIGGGLPEQVGFAITIACMVAFAAGWVLLGASALRIPLQPAAVHGAA